MSSRVNGYRVLVWGRTRPGVPRPRTWVPRRETWYHLVRAGHWLLLSWQPYRGMWLVADRVGSADGPTVLYSPVPEWGMTLKRRPGPGAAGAVQPAAQAASTIMGKLPAMREFLTATVYDDGSARAPGRLRIETQGTIWAVTVQDPDACARLTCRAPTLDGALLLVEQCLGVEDSPWELDRYLAQAQTTSKKKK